MILSWVFDFLYALQFAEAGHALVGALMPEHDTVAKISIIPRGQAGGLTLFAPSEERLKIWSLQPKLPREPDGCCTRWKVSTQVLSQS